MTRILNEDDLNRINELTDNGQKDYYKAYDYIYSRIKDNSNVSEGSKKWFQEAGEINRNDPDSAANVFIRSVSEDGLIWDGKTADLQNTSNMIGFNVIREINSRQDLPLIDVLINNDISVALSEGGQTLGGWGGSFYYWDKDFTRIDESGNRVTKTIGEWISSDVDEFEKFKAINAAATINQSIN